MTDLLFWLLLVNVDVDNNEQAVCATMPTNTACLHEYLNDDAETTSVE